MLTPLRGKTILIVERQPLVAADIEDRLLDAGAREVAIISKPDHPFALEGYDALIVNATQDSEVARRMLVAISTFRCVLIVLHDDPHGAQALYPGATIVEIPFDSESILHVLARALAQRAD